MGMSRAQLAANLWGLLQRQFTEVGISNEDSTGNLKEPVDFTLLALGTSYADLASGTVDDGDESDALTIARYQGLRTVYDAALAKVDVTIDAPNTSVKWSQYAAAIEKALNAAKAEALPLMATAVNPFGFATIALDHIEPYDVEDA